MAMLQSKNRVLTLAEKGAHTAAIALAADLARRDPDSAAGYALLAQAEEMAGYTKAAIQSISRAIARAPYDLAYRQTRARLYLAAKRADEALREMDCLIAIAQTNADEDYVFAARSCREELWGAMQRRAA